MKLEKISKPIFRHAGGSSDNIRIRTLTDAATPSIMGIDVKEFPEVHSVSYRFLSKTYHGVGVINQNNGIEFVGQDLTDSPMTLNSSGVTFLLMEKEHRSDKLCMFADMMDYLAYQTLQKNGFVRVPSDCDFMIMSDVRNFIHISVEGDDYDMVYLYFPNDVMGCTITKTLKDRYGKHAIECNPLYKGYNNLLQFVKAIEITTNSK